MLAAALVYCLFPLLWLLAAATKSPSELYGTAPFGLTPHAGERLAGNLRALFSRDGGVFARWLLNTLVYAGGGAALGTLLAALAGHALAWYRFPGRGLVSVLILGGVMVPPAVLAVPVFLLMSEAGLTNTMWAVLLPSLVSPVAVHLMRLFSAASVPGSLLEAARLDGLGEAAIFARVVFRLLAPGLTTVFLFQLVAVWNNFLLPLIVLSDQDLYPVTLGLVAWQGNAVRDAALTTLVITGSLVAVLPLIAAFLLLQRYWRADLAAGGVKD
ncbi:carbohydrate ABC transporter permease [Bailinhaonella thermotolerans]|uniref:Carbohydrate ABC transporter permease n=1 Tax=Bailinhaonella thermotolerans TaxID=1070861 RepID=A0A3A4A6R1_9ACTN|nr:carbohydrate ABC transporter permease [Bailinhaonella thermotolerans]